MACVTDTPGEYRLYQDLAAWWPLISPPGEYVADAAVLGRVFAAAPSAVRTVLDLGSGGGHVAWHLTGRLELTLLDRSEEMLAVSRELNPDCEHVQGDSSRSGWAGSSTRSWCTTRSITSPRRRTCFR